MPLWAPPSSCPRAPHRCAATPAGCWASHAACNTSPAHQRRQGKRLSHHFISTDQQQLSATQRTHVLAAACLQPASLYCDIGDAPATERSGGGAGSAKQGSKRVGGSARTSCGAGPAGGPSGCRRTWRPSCWPPRSPSVSRPAPGPPTSRPGAAAAPSPCCRARWPAAPTDLPPGPPRTPLVNPQKPWMNPQSPLMYGSVRDKQTAGSAHKPTTPGSWPESAGRCHPACQAERWALPGVNTPATPPAACASHSRRGDSGGEPSGDMSGFFWVSGGVWSAPSGRTSFQTPNSSRSIQLPLQLLKSPISCAAAAAGHHSRYTSAAPSRTIPSRSYPCGRAPPPPSPAHQSPAACAACLLPVAAARPQQACTRRVPGSNGNQQGVLCRSNQ